MSPASEMVWPGRTERADADQSGAGIEHAGNTVNLGGLEGLFEREGGQDRGHALGQHGFARAWRADHQDVTSGAGNLQRALGRVLATHVLEVH